MSTLLTWFGFERSDAASVYQMFLSKYIVELNASVCWISNCELFMSALEVSMPSQSASAMSVNRRRTSKIIFLRSQKKPILFYWRAKRCLSQYIIFPSYRRLVGPNLCSCWFIYQFCVMWNDCIYSIYIHLEVISHYLSFYVHEHCRSLEK